jgi:hypothetical protein
LAGVESCAGNHDGVYTACDNATLAPYFTNQKTPNQNTYNFAGAVGNSAATDGDLLVDMPGACAGAATPGNASIKVYQESGAVYCIHN